MDGRAFATARGWEDLSELLKVYEALGKKVDREVVHQYIQHWKIAKDFAGYLELYEKYQKDYGLEDILEDSGRRIHWRSFSTPPLTSGSAWWGCCPGNCGNISATMCSWTGM